MYVAISAISGIVGITAIILRYMNKKHQQEIDERKHIRHFKLKLMEKRITVTSKRAREHSVSQEVDDGIK
ncbi:hypothetical protein PAUR_a3027 [Pseudoalteromonas aurantia 208]|uniref:Uncharacterized protein n=2 Tax=Pseudoalteromonas aurantia TaxID=43654 RepID=A0ABR9EE52_9GAMM|nr:hypothetical protein [Pseudoalteromonas aurantia 208]